MKLVVNAAWLSALFFSACAPAFIAPSSASAQVRTGADVWLGTNLGDLAGKRIGLITNHTGVTRT